MTTKNVEAFYPLSPMQQGMFFHTLYAPHSGVYVEQLSCKLKGDLDVAAFREAWQRMIDRHTILRTAFMGEGLKEPVQVVHRKVDLEIEEHDWRAMTPVEQEQRLATFELEQQQRGVALSEPPLMRLYLLRLEDDAYRFVWCYHHILLDGWSMPLLFGEMIQTYEALCAGQTPHLSTIRPFRDYIAWLRSRDMAVAERFWRERLAGFTAPTPFMVDLPEIERDDESVYEDQAIELSVETTQSLQQWVQRNGLTANTLVQAAWALLLSRYSGENDVVFGATVSGRPADLPGAESMLGLFINTLPVRVTLPTEARLLPWLQELQAQQIETRQYEYSPLVQIQAWSDVPRGMPLFESILVFENYPVQSALENSEGSLAISDIRSIEQTNYPLNLIAGVSDRLLLRLFYDRSRFERDSIRRMLGHLSTMLESMVIHPDQSLADLPMLTESEQQQLLVEWNATDKPFPDDTCAHHLFEAQVERTPDAPAVIFGDTTLSYRELNRRANQLAHLLREMGVGPEILVGLCVERSIEMIVAILGVLKAGGAYLPLDPDYPQQRLAFMVEDAGVEIILAQEHLRELVSEHAAQLLCLDTDWDRIAERSDENPTPVTGPHNLAYVIYTSGSTGMPKGVLLEHRGMNNMAQAFIENLGMGPGHRYLLFFRYTFDGSVADIFTALLSGTTLYVVPQEQLMPGPGLHRLLRDLRITDALVAPAALSLTPSDGLPDLGVVLTGGDVCTLDLVERWGTGRRYINAYGPTECTVVTHWYTAGQPADVISTVPIGRPLPNVRNYIVDSQMRLVPIGVPGELLIGGVGLARGYLNRPELTRERFVANPFDPERSPRLYRTGDLVRYRPDGNIEFLGRLDNQVKIRGFRIELGEIEAALAQVPGVAEAVVVAREDEPDDKRLVAYLRPSDGTAPGGSELRATLEQKLPAYMIPSAFVSMEAFPVTPNGKIDRKALPAPDGTRAGAESEYVAPRDALELRLAQIWEEILNVERVGVTDNFFELGGHSLLAVRLMAQIQQQMGKTLSLVDLFQTPTVEHLALLIRAEESGSETSLLVPLRGGDAKRPLFFIHPSGGSVHWYADLARHLPKDQPLYGIQARGLNGDAPLDRRIEDMARRYVDALRSVQPEGPYMLGSWSMGVIVVYEMAQQLQALGEKVELLLLLDQGPVLPLSEPKNQAEYLYNTFGKHVPLSLAALEQMDEAEQVAHVFREAKRIKWLMPDVTLEQFGHFCDLLQTHTSAWRNYTPRPYAGKITLFRARRRPEDEDGNMDRDLGWGPLALGGVDVHDVPGDHLSMVHEPRVRILARELRRCLERLPTP